ncbi:MAG: prepilin peptidase [Pirellulales bacterium]|nr:prepilin peptidase [Pirellulales bacterium]
MRRGRVSFALTKEYHHDRHYTDSNRSSSESPSHVRSRASLDLSRQPAAAPLRHASASVQVAVSQLIAGVPIAEWPVWLRAFAAGWLFVLGSCFGSFLNVVAYRWPRRMSLSKPGSHCPHCSRPIAPRDNVPIMAWLWLRGRCRQCGGAIAARYPLVELLAGMAFLLVGWGELLTSRGGWLLAATHAHEGRATLALAGHLTLVTTLLAATLLVLDRAPWRGALYWPAAMVAGALVAARLPVAPILAAPANTLDRPPGMALTAAALGLAIGIALAAIWRITQRNAAAGVARYTVGCWLLVGVYLGPIATAGIAVIASLGELATAAAQRVGLSIDRLSTSGWLLAAVVVVLTGWTFLMDSPGLGAAQSIAAGRPTIWIVGSVAAAGAAMVITRLLARDRPVR